MLLFMTRSSSTWMSYVPHRKRTMLCLSGWNVNCWRHWQRTCFCPSISGLCRVCLLCLWLADSRTEKPLDKESGAASVLENEQRTVVTMTAYWTFLQMLLCTYVNLNLCWLWTSKLKLKLKLKFKKMIWKLKLKLKLELVTKPEIK